MLHDRRSAAAGFVPLFLLAGLFFLSSGVLYAATKTAVASGNWSTPSLWSPSGIPANNDDVVIPSGRTVTLKDAAAPADRVRRGRAARPAPGPHAACPHHLAGPGRVGAGGDRGMDHRLADGSHGVPGDDRRRILAGCARSRSPACPAAGPCVPAGAELSESLQPGDGDPF